MRFLQLVTRFKAMGLTGRAARKAARAAMKNGRKTS